MSFIKGSVAWFGTDNSNGKIVILKLELVAHTMSWSFHPKALQRREFSSCCWLFWQLSQRHGIPSSPLGSPWWPPCQEASSLHNSWVCQHVNHLQVRASVNWRLPFWLPIGPCPSHAVTNASMQQVVHLCHLPSMSQRRRYPEASWSSHLLWGSEFSSETDSLAWQFPSGLQWPTSWASSHVPVLPMPLLPSRSLQYLEPSSSQRAVFHELLPEASLKHRFGTADWPLTTAVANWASSTLPPAVELHFLFPAQSAQCLWHAWRLLQSILHTLVHQASHALHRLRKIRVSAMFWTPTQRDRQVIHRKLEYHLWSVGS